MQNWTMEGPTGLHGHSEGQRDRTFLRNGPVWFCQERNSQVVEVQERSQGGSSKTCQTVHRTGQNRVGSWLLDTSGWEILLPRVRSVPWDGQAVRRSTASTVLRVCTEPKKQPELLQLDHLHSCVGVFRSI